MKQVREFCDLIFVPLANMNSLAGYRVVCTNPLSNPKAPCTLSRYALSSGSRTTLLLSIVMITYLLLVYAPRMAGCTIDWFCAIEWDVQFGYSKRRRAGWTKEEAASENILDGSGILVPLGRTTQVNPCLTPSRALWKVRMIAFLEELDATFEESRKEKRGGLAGWTEQGRREKYSAREMIFGDLW